MKLNSIQPVQNPAFGCGNCNQIREIFIKKGVTPEAADKFLSIAAPRLAPEDTRLNKEQVDGHLKLANALLSAVRQFPDNFVQNIKNLIK